MSDRTANLQTAIETMPECKARHVDDKGKAQYTMVFEIPPVDSVKTAVKIAVVHGAHK